MNTQYEIIIQASKKKWISGLDALHLGAGMKLATRIGELKSKGYKFADRWVEKNGKKFKEYRYITKEF